MPFVENGTFGRFTVTKVLPIPELCMEMVELVHASGAQVLHLANSDEENLFCISFRTYPSSSNGVAHILEHTVLCGSEKFPVKDPFFGMNRRSLNTFMNAFTGGDFTCYPASSTHPCDFYNLLEVYLNAVFRPRLLKESFLQEGWRFELHGKRLTYQGIVFNEMKGALVSGESRLSEALMAALLPDTLYGVNSGGDPKEIPSLTHEELRAFHAQYYAPGNALFFFYGNLPLERHLTFLEERVLKDAQQPEPIPAPKRQPRFSEPRAFSFPYPSTAEEEEKRLVGFGFLTCSIEEQEDLLALQILDLVLMGTDAAPLKHALLQSDLCKQVGSAMDSEMHEVPYFLICKGCSAESRAGLEKLIDETLQRVVEEGLPDHLVQGALHQIELYRSEISSDTGPFGLSLFMRAGLLKQQGGRPESSIMVHSLFEKLRERLGHKDYLTGLLRRHFLENRHRVSVEMVPRVELEAEELQAETERLASIEKRLTAQERTRIVEEAEQLKAYQEQEEDLSVLPQIAVSDVARKAREFSLERSEVGSLSLFHHDCFTNGILYADLLLDLPEIGQEELPLLRLFSVLATQMGCGGRSYRRHLDFLLEHVGGISASLDLYLQAENPLLMRPALHFHGYGLHRKVDKLFVLFVDLLTSIDFTDVGRLRDLLRQHCEGLETSLQNSALRYALNLAGSGLSPAGAIHNQWYGLDYFWSVRAMLERLEREPSSVVAELQQLQQRLLGAAQAHLILSGEATHIREVTRADLFGLPGVLKGVSHAAWKTQIPENQRLSQGRFISSAVAFTAQVVPTVSYSDGDSPLLSLAAEIAENCVLHKRIREQGGAYGGGASHAAMGGYFSLHAYRDPHVARTLGAFSEAKRFLTEGKWRKGDLEEAKLGVVQVLDAPCIPAQRAMAAYARWRSGRRHPLRQQWRERMLDATREEIVEATRRHLLQEEVTVVFGGKELLERENGALSTPLPLYDAKG